MNRPIGSVLTDLLCSSNHKEFVCKFTLTNDSFSVEGMAIVESGNEHIKIIAKSSDIFYKNNMEVSNVISISASDVPLEYECVLTDIPKDKFNDIRLHNVNLVFPRVMVLPTFTLGNNTNIEGEIQPFYVKDSGELVRFVLPSYSEK